jgi:hypothetical protein
MITHLDQPVTPVPIPNKIVLQILDNLTDGDSELLSLARISKHIHHLALQTHLSRYGIMETDIATS